MFRMFNTVNIMPVSVAIALHLQAAAGDLRSASDG